MKGVAALAGSASLFDLSQRSVVEQLVAGSGGYDIPSFSGLRDFKIWAKEGPSKGTLYNYPPRNDEIGWIAASPAPTAIAMQMYAQVTNTKMIAKIKQGDESIDNAIAWAASELEGLMRV